MPVSICRPVVLHKEANGPPEESPRAPFCKLGPTPGAHHIYNYLDRLDILDISGTGNPQVVVFKKCFHRDKYGMCTKNVSNGKRMIIFLC